MPCWGLSCTPHLMLASSSSPPGCCPQSHEIFIKSGYEMPLRLSMKCTRLENGCCPQSHEIFIKSGYEMLRLSMKCTRLENGCCPQSHEIFIKSGYEMLKLRMKCTRLENIYRSIRQWLVESVQEKKGQGKPSLAPNLLLNWVSFMPPSSPQCTFFFFFSCFLKSR
jgi:hypothetical protein